MNAFDLLPHRIDILYPQIRIGNTVARRPVNVRRALEYLQTGLYRQHFSASGEFLGIVYSPETARPLKPHYIPEEMPMLEVVPLKFIDPLGATPTYLRTVTDTLQ